MDPIKTFITRPVFTAMLVLSLVVFGLFAYPKIGVDQFPEVEFPVVTVTTMLIGADPESIERDVTDPLEEALNTLSGLDKLISINVESISQIVVQFDLDKDADVAAQEVRDRVQATLGQLPTNIETPVVEKFDIGAAPVMSLAVTGSLPIQELTQLVEDDIKPQLERQEGVGSITVIGGREREIRIEVDPARLRSYGLAASDVVAAIQAQNLDLPSGRTAEAGRERTVKLTAETHDVEQIRELIIPAPTPSPVRIRDVAAVIDGPEEERSAATFDGRNALILSVQKQSDANTVEVAGLIAKSLAGINSTLPEGVEIHMVSDNSRFIRAAIESVEHDLVIGGILAVFIVLVFLRNGRSTLISAVALPVSVIGTFAVMHALDFTFNMITMLALTLSIGLLIDDAIVVIENVVRHIEEGKTPFMAAWEGTKEIALAVFAVTLSIVAVFIPVAFMEGIMGRFFYQFGVTVAVAVLISFFVSLTLTPMMSSMLLTHHGEGGRISQTIERGLRALEAFYKRMLYWMLAHRGIVMGGAVGVLLLTFVLAGQLQSTFIPESDAGTFKVALELPVGSNLQQTKDRVADVAAQIAAIPGVSSIGTSAGGGAQEEVHKGEIFVNLVPIAERNYRQQELMAWLRENLVRPADTIIGVLMIDGVGGGQRTQQVQFNVRGDDWAAVTDTAEKMLARMHENPMFVDVDSTYRPGKPQLNVNLDRRRAAELGVPAATVGQTLRAFMGGDKVADFRDGSDTYEIKLRLPEYVLADPVQLGGLTVRGGSGGLVELRNIASIDPGEGPSQIDREARKRQITLLANLSEGYALSDAMTYMDELGKELAPDHIIATFGGNAEDLAEAAIAFGLAILLAVVLLYMILAAQFESLIDPVTIMVSLPFAVIGAIVGLLVAGEMISMFAMIGMIMLMGLVAKNGILLVDFTNQMKRQGMSTYEALITASPMRLRPILMTTIAMIGGMMPPMLARGDGAETRVPMAVAIIGGLISSTVLTLGVVPVVYSLLDGLRGRFSLRNWGRKADAAEAEPEPSVAAD